MPTNSYFGPDGTIHRGPVASAHLKTTTNASINPKKRTRNRRKVNQDPYGGDSVPVDDYNNALDDFDFDAFLPCDPPMEQEDCSTSLGGSWISDRLPSDPSSIPTSARRLAQVRKHFDDPGRPNRWIYQHAVVWFPGNGGQDMNSGMLRLPSEDFSVLDISGICVPPTCMGETGGTPYAGLDETSQRPLEATFAKVLLEDFHCPYYRCHSNWELAKMEPEGDRPSRCVHIECNVVPGSREEWLQHVMAAHHDLQPIPQLGFVEMDAKTRPVL